jgi:chromosome segregation ATPase
MARTGLYKSEVKKARDSLIAQNINPSVDAVRVALGNTGSKTTIHKYLKELEEEGVIGGSNVTISDALQNLVEGLAAQLQDEANSRIELAYQQNKDKEQQHAEALAALQKENMILSEQLQRIETSFHQEVAAHGQTRDLLQQETMARHTFEQQLVDIRDRLAENDTHRLSLEEKHKHARDALEHYRQSVKEQRDQDQRRHEQQIQQLQAEMRQLQQTLVIKQEDITRLNQEGTRLVTDLSHAQKMLYDQQSSARQFEKKLDALQGIEQHCKNLEANLEEKDMYVNELKNQVANASTQATELSKLAHRLELELTVAHTKLEVQQTMTMELRTYMERQEMVAVGLKEASIG